MSTREDATEAVDLAVDQVARAMTAHPAPDLAARVRARLAGPAPAPRFGLHPAWGAAALAGVVVLALRLAPGPEQAAAPATTAVAQSAPPVLSGSGPGVNPSPVPQGLTPRNGRGSAPAPRSVRRGPARTPVPATPAEPWPGDELGARPLRYEPLAAPPLAAPPLAVDTIALDPLSRAEPLIIETAGVADGAARPGEEETR